MRKRWLTILSVVLLIAAAMSSLPSLSQSPSAGTPMATADRVQLPGWWPTKGTPARNEYVGPAACTKCHAQKAASTQQTPMAHASMLTADSDILRVHSLLNAKIGPYSYELKTEKSSTFSVTDGKQSISTTLAWAFGIGEVGQTYVYEKIGHFYESRLSFYKNTQALDFSPGHPRSIPINLDDALGRPFYAGETQRCFGCHTTASTTGNRFDAAHLIPGVTCEACHGPGAEHVVAMTTSDGGQVPTLIMNPRNLRPVDSVEFCGACHRTLWDVALGAFKRIYSIRFQPYRLESSRCWGNGDSRLTCITCHDPHQPLVRDDATYDSHCLACHLTDKTAKASRDHPGAACPVSTKDCVTCHMPKREIPGMHSQFTDHKIQITRKDGTFND